MHVPKIPVSLTNILTGVQKVSQIVYQNLFITVCNITLQDYQLPVFYPYILN